MGGDRVNVSRVIGLRDDVHDVCTEGEGGG